jgi:hypothetical protein
VAEKMDIPIYLHPSLPSPEWIQREFSGNYSSRCALVLSTAAWDRHENVGLHVLKLYSADLFECFPLIEGRDWTYRIYNAFYARQNREVAVFADWGCYEELEASVEWQYFGYECHIQLEPDGNITSRWPKSSIYSTALTDLLKTIDKGGCSLKSWGRVTRSRRKS